MTSITLDQITFRVRKIIAGHCGADLERVDLSTTMEDCQFDSLDHVQISMFVEQELRIHIPDDMIGHQTTVAQIIDHAAEELGAS